MSESILTPVKAIRAYCIECMGGDKAEVRRCNLICPLWPYRLGKNPNRKGQGGKAVNTENGNSSCENEAENEED